MKEIAVRKYCDADTKLWNEFISTTSVDTFLFNRDYMDYHRDVYHDDSTLVFRGNTLCAVFPATPGDSQGELYSHSGLTYGGLLPSTALHSADVGKVMKSIAAYYLDAGYQTLYYKPIPHIYHLNPAEADLYWLYRAGAKLLSRNLSATIDLQNRPTLSELRRRKTKLAVREGLIVREGSENDFKSFWTILTQILQERHNCNPVHNINEILLLHSRFPNSIKLHVAVNANNSVIAGCVVYLMKRVVHVQYIAANAEGRSCGALDLLFTNLIETLNSLPPNEAPLYLDFGISTENGGNYFNAGLQFQKEGFGARGVCYDTYCVSLERLAQIEV